MKYFVAPLLLFSFLGFSADVSLEQAKTDSAVDGKPILIDFFAVWCGPCKKFTKESKTDSDIQKALGQVHLVKLDAEKGEGADLAKAFSVKGYPTFVLADKDMNTLNRWWGYEKEHFIEKMDAALAEPMTIDARLARFEQEKNLKDAEVLAGFYETQNKFDEALAMYQAADTLNQDPEKSYALNIFQIKLGGYFKEQSYDFQTLDALGKEILDSGKHEDLELLGVADPMIHVAKKEGRADAIRFYLEKGIAIAERNKDKERMNQILGGYQADHALHIDKDESAAVAFIKASYNEGWEQDATQLNRFSWWCFENKVNLKEAKILAGKAYELSEAGTGRANILDTWAEIENALGNPAAAVELMEKAVNEAPDSENHKKQLERFRKLVEEKKANSKS